MRLLTRRSLRLFLLLAVTAVFASSVPIFQSYSFALVDTSSHHSDIPVESINAQRHDNGQIICNRCTINIGGTPGPPGPEGPPGPQGPPGDTRQTIVTLHDDAEGNAAGWNPPLESTNTIFIINAPFKLEPGFSLEATFTNPPRDSPGGEIGPRSGNCHLTTAFEIGQTFPLRCGEAKESPVEEGATLTYVITK